MKQVNFIKIPVKFQKCINKTSFQITHTHLNLKIPMEKLNTVKKKQNSPVIIHFFIFKLTVHFIREKVWRGIARFFSRNCQDLQISKVNYVLYIINKNTCQRDVSGNKTLQNIIKALIKIWTHSLPSFTKDTLKSPPSNLNTLRRDRGDSTWRT